MENNTPMTQAEVVSRELERFDPYVARLSELEAQFKDIKINGLDDVDGYQENKRALAELRKLRTATEEERKEAKSLYLEIGRSIDQKAKLITEGLLAIEAPLREQKEWVDSERERQKQEKKQREDEQLARRSSTLSQMGATLQDGVYRLGEALVELPLLREAPEETWECIILPPFESEYQVREKERLAREAEEKRQREEQDRERQRLEAERRLLEEERRSLQQRLEQEIKQRVQERDQELVALGFTYSWAGEKYLYEGKIEVPLAEVKTKPQAEWTKGMEGLRQQVQAHRQKKAEQAEAEQKRRDEEIRQRAIKEEQERREREEARQKEELAQASDRDKWLAFRSDITALQVPAMSSGRYKKLATLTREKIDEILNLHL